MSEIAVATARVIVRPDTTLFTQQLLEEVNRAISRAQSAARPIQIQAALSGFSAAALSQTTALAAAQQTATASTLGLASAAQVENSAFGRQAVILEAATAATNQKAGADARAATTARAHAQQIGQVRTAAIAGAAGMLGLRGAVLTAGVSFIAATAGLQAFGRAVQSSIDFERELNVFAETSGATADQLERVSEVARELGRDITLPGVAANDAAQTLSLLARAGLSVEDSLNAVRGTLQLATAAELENAQAAELVANALNSFRLDGAEAARVADLLAGAANESQGSIEDMGLALRQVAAIASGLGVSIEDTVTLLTQLSRAGLSSSDAGTSLRQTFLRLIQDLPKVNDAVERLGLNLRDAQGNIRVEIFEELGDKLKELTPAVRQKAIADLGGADAIRTYLTLTRASAGEFDAVADSITRAGLAQEFASARTEGLGGDVEATKNEFADLGLTVGQLASGPLSLFVRTAGEAAGAVNDLANEIERTDQGFGETFGNFLNRFEQTFARINFQFRQGIRGSHEQAQGFTVLGRAADATATAVQGLADALREASDVTLRNQGIPEQGLNPQQILNRLAGFDEQQTLAKIRGDSQALVAGLEAEQAFLNQQLERAFVQRRPELRRRLQDALLGAGNELASISKAASAETERAAREAKSAQRQADQALLDLLGDRREDVQRKIDQAATTEGIADDIRFQNRLQALIKQQIAKVRAQVRDEQLRAQAVRELRIALIASRREEEALRAERAAQAAANRQESAQLDVELAEITGNVSREIAARQRLIALLRKQQADVKKGTAEWKRLRNEIARQQQAIKDARDQADEDADDGRRAQEFFFSQLQAQQGFAANLLGNLITGPTAGLVGVPSPTPAVQVNLGAALGAAAGVAEGRSKSAPTAGQASTTNELLAQILGQLKVLNQTTDAPEAINNKKTGAAYMDGIGGGSGAAAVM